MKRLTVILSLLAFCIGAKAQAPAFLEHIFELNSNRLDAGLTLGQVASFTDYARFGFGASVQFKGIYVDFLKADPQHMYNGEISDTKWNDTSAFCINAGYQIPIFGWLRIVPLLGYAQTNDGITDGTSLQVSAGDDTPSWYHRYEVIPGSRTHYFNYGGGLSVQPCKWFSVNAFFTSRAIYGGVAVDLISIAGLK